MAATTFKPLYATSGTVTITLASLASSSTLTTGRVGTQIDNSTNLYDDIFISGKFKVAAAGLSAGTIEVWVIPETDDSSVPDSISTTDAAYTATSRDILAAEGVLAWSVSTSTTASLTYPMRKTSVAGLFAGGVCPRKFSVFVTQSTGAALDSTAASHEVATEGVNEQGV